MNTGSHSSHLLNPQHRTKASQPVDTYVVQIKVRQNSQPIQKIWRGDSLLSIGHPIQWTIETTETGMRMRDLRSPINLVSKTAVKEIEFSEIFEKEWIELPLSENSKNTPASVRIRKTKTLEALYNSIETGKEILLVQYLNQSILDSFPLKDSSFVQYGGENLFQTQWENENLKVTSQLSELQVRQDKKNIPSENGTWSIPRSKLLNTSIHLNALSWKFGTESAGSIPQIPHIEIKKELGDESRFFKKSIQGIIGALAIFLITIALWPQAEEKEEE
ncbi:MAG: hypothetical protein CL678_08325, partial [Bdellovibrionaceae bacterium]|nr:hypothetical protein [Pseudobdellovibrionaceae bacterium]